MNKYKSRVYVILLATAVSVFAVFFTLHTQAKSKPASIEAQIKELQKDYSGVIQEKDSKYGKLVFYSLDRDETHGVGLAIFKKQDNDWIYVKGTSHLIDSGAGTSDQVIINKDIMVIYGYFNEKLIHKTKEIGTTQIKDGVLNVTNSYISYGFVNPNFKYTIKIKP